MKSRKWTIGAVVMTFSMLMGGCGKEAAKPVDIVEGVDKCDVCHMNVPNDHNATEIVLQNGKVLKFDDIGCMHRWTKEHENESVEAKFVRDYLSQEWVNTDQATYVYDKSFETPMGYGIYSFKDKEAAEAFVKEKQTGLVMSVQELDKHTWERSMKKHGKHKGDSESDQHGSKDDQHGMQDNQHGTQEAQQTQN
ncbi:nitrous oxide reductase accessory protein NosL [Brevibacillus sp. MCWH]|jgi:copper chaperone NosL|uniref:nitrous oxide reductase accessory protein NosL n=1 Tax=Brevibacillus sp. MCWH TaxID=2508871 RepID=UPI00209BD4C6|nr:nitrous oxide reductase accessory protein NosL [Brevibacillus sp. MCWH]